MTDTAERNTTRKSGQPATDDADAARTDARTSMDAVRGGLVRFRRPILIIVTLTFVAAGGYYYFQQSLLPHFRPVREGVLYRSGQPRGAGLEWLKQRGIRTLVNLRAPESKGTAEEKAFAEANGLRFVSIPIGTEGFEMEESADAFLKIMEDDSNWPVLVHCSRGKERAGLMSAVFRIRYDGWDNEDAAEEAEDLGLDPGDMPVAQLFISTFDDPSNFTEKAASREQADWEE